MELTQKKLKEIMYYNHRNGDFIWQKKLSPNQKKGIGEIAGKINDKGYIEIHILTKTYKAHRLAFLYMNGEIPKTEIDHKNKCRSDNRWKNIRVSSDLENMKNKSKYSVNTSGTTGVHVQKGRWIAQIQVDKNKIYLGMFENKEDAIKKRQDAEDQYGFTNE